MSNRIIEGLTVFICTSSVAYVVIDAVQAIGQAVSS